MVNVVNSKICTNFMAFIVVDKNIGGWTDTNINSQSDFCQFNSPVAINQLLYSRCVLWYDHAVSLSRRGASTNPPHFRFYFWTYSPIKIHLNEPRNFSCGQWQLAMRLHIVLLINCIIQTTILWWICVYVGTEVRTKAWRVISLCRLGEFRIRINVSKRRF